MKALETAQKWFIRVMAATCIILFAAMVLLVGAQVVVRFIARNAVDMSWSEEANRYLLCWMTFFGAVLVYEARGHVWVANLVDAVPKTIRKIMLFISYLVQLAFFAAVLVGAAEYLPTVAAQTSAVLHVPLHLVYIVVPITAVCTAVFCVRDMVLMLADKEDTNG